jgi:hypothetical protein
MSKATRDNIFGNRNIERFHEPKQRFRARVSPFFPRASSAHQLFITKSA